MHCSFDSYYDLSEESKIEGKGIGLSGVGKTETAEVSILPATKIMVEVSGAIVGPVPIVIVKMLPELMHVAPVPRAARTAASRHAQVRDILPANVQTIVLQLP